MNVITPGHNYELENFENKNISGQRLQFIHKEPIQEGSPYMKVYDPSIEGPNKPLIKGELLREYYSKYFTTQTVNA